MDKAAETPPEPAATSPGPWDAARAHEAAHSRAAPNAGAPALADDAAKKPPAGMALMIGVVVALLLAAALAWVVLGQAIMS